MAVIDMTKQGTTSAEGTLEADLIIGTVTDNVLFGNYGDNVLNGNGGNDTFILNTANGFDFYDGGQGYDAIFVTHSQSAYYVNWSEVQIGSITSVEKIESDGVRPTYIVVQHTADFTNRNSLKSLIFEALPATTSSPAASKTIRWLDLTETIR